MFRYALRLWLIINSLEIKRIYSYDCGSFDLYQEARNYITEILITLFYKNTQ